MLVRSLVLAAALVLPSLGGADAASAQGLENSPAPAFDLPDLRGGRPIRLSDYRGKVVYLDFWASWCGPCRLSMPAMEALQAAYAGRPFAVLSIDLDRSRDDGRAFLARTGADYPAAWDRRSRTLSAYGAAGLPMGVLIDANGVIRVRHMGFQPDQNTFLGAHIDQLLADQALGIVRTPDH